MQPCLRIRTDKRARLRRSTRTVCRRTVDWCLAPTSSGAISGNIGSFPPGRLPHGQTLHVGARTGTHIYGSRVSRPVDVTATSRDLICPEYARDRYPRWSPTSLRDNAKTEEGAAGCLGVAE